MSDIRHDPERDLLAAELALGLLEGDELREARALRLSDRAFAAEVEAWQLRLAPLADEAAEVEPDPRVWAAIAARLGAVQAAAGGNVVELRRKLTVWKGWAAGMAAVAASLALALAYQSGRDGPPAVVQPAPVLVASLSSEQADASLSVAYDGGRSSLLVTPGRLTGAAGHDHELWVIPPGGQPVSLGLVRPGAPQRLRVPVSLAPHFRSRSAIAVSVEPTGGSPTGKPTGPVIASGELSSL
ncbi:MAG TPA: anti-sigma factor [Allosphingosinicella sp.]|jgi:anti-sigma-K factor RskA